MLRYSSPFLVLAGIPLLYYWAGPLWPIAGIMAFLIVLVTAERLADRPGCVERQASRKFRALQLIYVPLQLAVVVWATSIAASLTPLAFVLLAVSVGVAAGIFGMLCAHELAHSHDRFDRFVALAMLTGTSNRPFRISHIFGHHRWAATERDAATARKGESFYAFLARTLPSQWREAWGFERGRCAARAAGWWENRVLQDVAATMMTYAVVTALFGTSGILFFLTENMVAIVVLELFNYIAHYGMVRDAGDAGRKGPISDTLSWNSSSEFANCLIFNMGRHSDHHRRPAASYQDLVAVSGSPELPCGYAGSILLALMPPLWRRVMDPHVVRIRSGQTIAAAGAAVS